MFRINPGVRAFTLIEVLVSLAIFAVAAVVLGATYVNLLENYAAVSRRQEHEQELRLARAQLLGEPDRRRGEEGGTLDLPGNRTAFWRASIRETGVADLFRVGFHCEIRAPGLAAPWMREEIFMLLRPTWSDPAVRNKLRAASQQRLAQQESR